MFSLSVAGLLHAAGARPLFQAAAIIFGTFVLEDAATVLAAVQAQDGALSTRLALLSLYTGIVLGDLGLYGLGRLAAAWPRLRRLLPPERRTRGKAWIEQRVFRVVFISRFVPGARLPTYTSCGYLGASFARFAGAAILATLVWTTLLFWVSAHVGRVLMDHFGAWRWVGVLIFVLVIILIGRVVARAQEETE